MQSDGYSAAEIMDLLIPFEELEDRALAEVCAGFMGLRSSANLGPAQAMVNRFRLARAAQDLRVREHGSSWIIVDRHRTGRKGEAPARHRRG